MNRAQRRARNRKIKKSKRKKTELEQKLGLFDLMPEECMVCMEPFDRKNKEQVKTWNVVVREKESIVRVYCPTCWNKAKQIIDEIGIDTS
tara:strand:- start:451 stop:720 length:270 start_codon:yes stop_codon:yes gene_type:complete